MFGSLGGPELILILVLALLLFGPRKIPEIGRALGRTVGEFRKATAEFRATLEREVELEKIQEAGEGLKAAGREAGAVARETSVFGRLGAPVAPAAPDPGPYGAGEPGAERPALGPEGRPAASRRAPTPFEDDDGSSTDGSASLPSRDGPPLG